VTAEVITLVGLNIAETRYFVKDKKAICLFLPSLRGGGDPALSSAGEPEGWEVTT